MNVQGLAERDDQPGNPVVLQSCLACGGMHLVDRRSGHLIAQAIQQSPAEDD